MLRVRSKKISHYQPYPGYYSILLLEWILFGYALLSR